MSKFFAIIRSQFVPRMIFSLTMKGPNQFVSSIFELASLLLLCPTTFAPISNLFVHLFRTDGKIRDALIDLSISISNSLAKSVCEATRYICGGSTATLGLMSKSISKGDFPSILPRLLYPPSIS